MLKGKKTYIAAGLTILGVVGGYLSGTVLLPDAIQAILTAVFATAIRSGIATTGK